MARYQEVCGGEVKFKKVPIPFLDDLVKSGPCAPSDDGDWHECPWCCGRFSPDEFRKGRGKTYTDSKLGGSTESAATGLDQVRGELADNASSVLMKVLYGARMARFDLVRAVCTLATRVTKWATYYYSLLTTHY